MEEKIYKTRTKRWGGKPSLTEMMVPRYEYALSVVPERANNSQIEDYK